MENLTEQIRDKLLSHGASLVGFADLSVLPPEQRYDMPTGVAIALAYPKDTIRGIADMPTAEYHEQYNLLNEKLDILARLGADFITASGYKAIPLTREFVGFIDGGFDGPFETVLPYKTVARLAGLGWIGKSALFVTHEYGSMIRLRSILTDAPLETAESALTSNCGNCKICTEACPGGAVLGNNWVPGAPRETVFDAAKCNRTARERMERSTGVKGVTICGKCIAVCPHTKAYLNKG